MRYTREDIFVGMKFQIRTNHTCKYEISGLEKIDDVDFFNLKTKDKFSYKYSTFLSMINTNDWQIINTNTIDYEIY